MPPTPKSLRDLYASTPARPRDCAVVMPKHDNLAPSSNPFEHIYDDIIKPACDLAGLFPSRTEAQKPLSPLTLRGFVDAPLAICMLEPRASATHFLLGARVATGRPSIVLYQAGQEAEYDVPEIIPVEYRRELRYHEVVADQKALAAHLIQIKTTVTESEDRANDMAEETELADPDDFDTRKMLQLIHYQLNALQAEVQMAVRGPDTDFLAEELTVLPDTAAEDTPPLQQGEQSYLHARKLYANGASHKEIFSSLKMARNKLVDALKLAQESSTALRIHELLRKTTEFEKYLLG